ncbi:MAG: excinuclease ABC subunit A [Planctomyces sp.]|nr:excinuclease ABC subunit A [Planctomyces sp.]
MRVRGAREHNLKGVDIDIPRDRLVVITGLSGSGKSSLAFDTVFAEGQRKYMESLSAYARQFLDQLKKPDIEEIQGLPPTIAIEQRSSGHNPRSTVATSTEIYDYLRVLYARCGRATCWHPTRVKKDGTVVERCGRPITATASTQIVDAVLGGAQGARALVLAPVVRAQKGYHREALVELQRQGWGRVRVNGSLVEIREALKDEGENPLGLGRYEKHTIEAVIDRVVVRADQRQRLAESIESALRVGDQTVIVAVEGPAEGEAAGGKGAGAAGDVPGAARWEDRVYSARHACAVHPECALEELSPRLFSFNSPHGACPACHGLGVIMEFADELLVPDMDKSLAGGAIAPWRLPAPMGTIYRRQLRRFCKGFGVSPQASVGSLSERLRGVLLRGASAADEKEYGEKFAGVGPLLRSWYEKTDSAFVKEWLGGFMHEETCPGCGGDRLRVESLCVRLTGVRGGGAGAAGDGPGGGTPAGDGPAGDGPGAVEHEGLNIAQLAGLNIRDASRFVEGLALSREQAAIAEPILKEVSSRLRFLRSVGLEYLSLSRRTATLSGGEAQRIRLATQVGSGLVGACYVLDEPTIGLHQRDNDRLITTLRRLSDIGNTVLVVEHDEDMIRQADWVVDIGPGPGVHGGRVVACGSVEDLCACPGSVTGAYLSGRRGIAVPAARRRLSQDRAVVVKGARQNNLKGIDAVFPLGGLVCVTGVSGSGKSTLVNEILLCAALRHAHGSRLVPGAHDRVLGLAKIDRVIDVDQSPIGRTPRSNPATYTGAFDEIRKVFAGTKEAQIRGYKGGRFSFNVAGKSGGGRCEACEGQGLKRIEMHFLPDVYVACEVCGGSRYNRETLEVRYRGRSIADVLDMTVEDAAGFFENHPKIQRHAVCLRDVGLGYLRLGQPSTQLSGGEAQRIKLAFELAKGPGVGERPAASEADEGFKAKARRFTAAAHTLYVLDEPTTGLHFEDIRRLIEVLNRLADAGNSLVVIEHNLDVIKCADWVIDLGPEGGDQGGAIVAAGTPEAIAGDPRSHTGRYLSKVLGAG